MCYLGIDLSLRSTGICFHCEEYNETEFKLLKNKDDDNETLLYNNTNNIVAYIRDIIQRGRILKYINIEGLSFNSISNSKDIIAGNFWYLRTILFQMFPTIPINIIPVTTWRSPLFNKEERKQITIYTKEVKEIKKQMKSMSREEKKHFVITKETEILGADIKYQTFVKLPEHIRNKILTIVTDSGKYDLTDSYFICLSMKNK